MSHYPDGKKVEKEETAPIERDDFPAPPFLYADEARRRRWSEPMKQDEAEEAQTNGDQVDHKLKQEEKELRKISTGSSMGRVFLDTVKQREKINAERRAFVDPRSCARTPSATREPHHRLRYDSPVNASPSRLTGSPRADTATPDPGHFYRSSSGRSLGTPGYSTPGLHQAAPNYRVVSSLGGPPKPGYTARKSSTLPSPSPAVNGSLSPGFTAFEAGLGEKTYSTDFSSRSDLSEKSFQQHDARRDLRASTTYTQGLVSTSSRVSTAEPPVGHVRSYSQPPPHSHMNRSLPNMNAALPKAPKIYPIHLLLTSNYRLPNDVDRCNLERHLSDTDFELVFEVNRSDFYRLPLWRRSDMKKRVKLF